MDNLLDRRKFLHRSLTYCSGLAVLMAMPSLAGGRKISAFGEVPVAVNEFEITGADIRVIGVGCGGCIALNSMIGTGIPGVKYIAVNRDEQALGSCLATNKLNIGSIANDATNAATQHEFGRKAAEAHSTVIAKAIHGTDLLFIVAGLGGSTGTGAAPVIAKIAKDQGILTAGVVTTPFPFEGGRRAKQAADSLRILEDTANSTIVVPNTDLLTMIDRKATLLDAFRMADDSLCQAVAGISTLYTIPGLSDPDFYDVRAVINLMRSARVRHGVGQGVNRAVAAMQQAINSPLLGAETVESAAGVILNISCGPDIGQNEALNGIRHIQEFVRDFLPIVYGFKIFPEQAGTVVATIIAGR